MKNRLNKLLAMSVLLPLFWIGNNAWASCTYATIANPTPMELANRIATVKFQK